MHYAINLALVALVNVAAAVAYGSLPPHWWGVVLITVAVAVALGVWEGYTTRNVSDDYEPPEVIGPIVVNIGPGDTVVFTSTRPLTRVDAENIKERIGKYFPDVTAIVIDHGISLSHVIKAEK